MRSKDKIMTQPAPFKTWQQALILFLAGTLYWSLVARFLFVGEPWDASLYWPVLYPGAIAIAGVLGAWSGWRADLIGLGLILPQTMVIVIATGATPMIFVGLFFAALLSLPAIFAAWLASRILRRR